VRHVKGKPPIKPSKPKRPASRPSATTNVAKHTMRIPGRWQTQTCQLGGSPAVAIYRGGMLRRITRLLAPTGLSERSTAMANVGRRLPAIFGPGDDRALVGQIRDGLFETLAVSTVVGRTLLAVSGFTPQLDTPATRRLQLVGAVHPVSIPAPQSVSSVIVISSLYKHHLTIHWFDRNKGKRLFTLRLKRDPKCPIYTSILDTRPSKGGTQRGR
jgi:hypothetical protein